jgi:tetrahydromethanopterin S-methyltransferase subunit A
MLSSALKVKAMVDKANGSIETFHKTRHALLIKLSEKNENNEILKTDSGEVRLSEENMKEFTSQLNSLLEEEVELGKLRVQDLGDSTRVSAADLSNLSSVLEF